MSRSLTLLVALAFAGCGDTAKPAQAPATTAATTPQTAEALQTRYAAEAKTQITKENAQAAADELLKEISADTP